MNQYINLTKELPLLNIKLKPEIVYPTPLTYTIIRYTVEDILESDFINELKNAGLELRELQMFIAPPNSTGGIHIDGHQIYAESAAINFVLHNNVDWEMQWFNIKILKDIKQLTTISNTCYIPLNSNQCTLIHTFKSNHPFILRTGVAHRVINLGNKHRYCISLRFKQNDFSTILKNANQYFANI